MVWMRRLLWSVGALLLLWMTTWLVLPPLVKWQAEQRLTDLLGRRVTLGEVSFHPWSLQLTVTDVAIAAAAGSASTEPQFTLGRVQVDVDARSLWRLAPVVESLQIDGPRLRVARTGDGHYDIDDVLRRLTPKPDQSPSGGMPRFALYNVELRGGELLFDDAPVKARHHVSGLTLTLPFLSSLPSQLDVKVEPRLAFTLDGAHYDSGAQAMPFATSHSGTLTLRVAALDLEPYIAYLPDSLPVRVGQGRVSADLALEFAAPEQGEASLSVRGKVGAGDVAIAEPGGVPLLELGQFALELRDVQPLARKVALGALRIDGLALHLARDAHGAVSVQRLLRAPAAAAAASAPANTLPSAPPAAWQASLDSLEVVGARVLWNDAAVKPASSWVLDGLALSAQRLRWPAGEAIPFSLRATLRPQGEASTALAVVSVDGQANESSASASFDLSGLSLAAVAPYINAASHVQVGGTGAAKGHAEWAAATSAQAQRIVVAVDQMTLDRLTADDPTAGKAGKRGETLSMQRLQLAGVAIDLATQSIAIASAKLQRPQVYVERSADGVWNLMRLAGPTPLAESERVLVREAAEATWQFRLDDLALDDGRVRLIDAAPAPARAGAAPETVRLSIDKLRLGLQGLQLLGSRLVSTPKLQLDARIADEREADAPAKPALVEWRGRFGMQPLMVAGKVRVERLPLHAVRAYGVYDLGLRLMHADAGFKGDVSMRQDAASGLSADLSGDVMLSDLRVDEYHPTVDPQPAPGEERLLSWQALAVNGLSVALRPGAVPKVIFREATLNDYFASLVLTERGTLNLNRVVPHRDGPAEPANAAASSAVAATQPRPAPAHASRRVAAAVSSAASSATTAAVNALPVDLDVGGIRLAGGRVDFSDHFVKPNYSAKLTELNGTLGAFRTGSGEPAVLQLSGRVAGTGLLEIGGKLKPGSVPRELDIAAKATDIELAPLSAYSGKYAGYAIERGKLSVEVHYKIDPDGKLDASHQLILNQLTFGDRVESPDATKLPVRFVVSLLKDKNGVIDLNLPVSGTIDDPQFSLGPLIWKVIVNLIVKIVSSPFAMFSGDGGPDLSVVPFEPGTGQPTAGGLAAIDKVAKALTERPALKVTLTGEADVDAEREAYQRATVEQQLRQEQRREQHRASGAASAPETAPVLAEADRARLVKELYRQTDLPDKPRNLIGLKADIPTEQMEALLRANVQASPEAMRELALQRGLVARDALVAKGLANDRLFLGDPKLRADAVGAAAAASAAGAPDGAAWTPQVRLSLDNK